MGCRTGSGGLSHGRHQRRDKKPCFEGQSVEGEEKEEKPEEKEEKPALVLSSSVRKS